MANIQKHAYCIIAHNDERLLNILLSQLDDIRNDIFLLIDSKSYLKNEDILTPQKSRLFLLPRMDIRWGDISQIDAELNLFNYVKMGGVIMQ